MRPLLGSPAPATHLLLSQLGSLISIPQLPYLSKFPAPREAKWRHQPRSQTQDFCLALRWGQGMVPQTAYVFLIYSGVTEPLIS